MATTAKSNTGAIRIRKSGQKSIVELIVPQGTSRKDILKNQTSILTEALKKIDLGACPACISGREFRITEAAVLPANFSVAKRVLEVNFKTGKILTKG